MEVQRIPPLLHACSVSIQPACKPHTFLPLPAMLSISGWYACISWSVSDTGEPGVLPPGGWGASPANSRFLVAHKQGGETSYSSR
jgi:hypothetical protein